MRQFERLTKQTAAGRAKMNRWPFTADDKTASQCQHTAKKLIHGGAPGDMAVVLLYAVNNKRNAQPVMLKTGQKSNQQNKYYG